MNGPEEEGPPPSGPEERRRQFEDSRGLSGRPALPLDDDEGTGENEEPSGDENERDAEGDEQ